MSLCHSCIHSNNCSMASVTSCKAYAEREKRNHSNKSKDCTTCYYKPNEENVPICHIPGETYSNISNCPKHPVCKDGWKKKKVSFEEWKDQNYNNLEVVWGYWEILEDCWIAAQENK